MHDAGLATSRGAGETGSSSEEPGSSASGDPDNPPERPSPRDERAADETISLFGGSVDLNRGWIESSLRALVPHLSRPSRRIVVRIVGDEEMTLLHDRHSGIDATTDVLTFDQSAADGPIEADLAVCEDEARRCAATLGHTVERELLLYILHGLLHCCGFDDHDDEAYARMHAEEDRLLESIGVGRTFNRAESGHDDPRGNAHRDPDHER
ncbi:MAG: rRNA maturation RNase YbeY [Phycisphaerales bacterium]|nr:MAG: rRNA maturation RNase YbeY [Phycisphaerales bacterium]